MFEKIITDDKFRNFIYNTRDNNIISYILSSDNSVVDFGSFLRVDSKTHISYIPFGKNNEKNRVQIKIGKIVSKAIKNSVLNSYSVTDSDIEKFVNIFKGYFGINESNLKIVSMEEILHWYDESNYLNLKKGQLWNSCMRYKDRNHLMNLYSVNDNIKMLVNIDTDSGLLTSRALLWDGCIDNHGRNIKIMDRVYSIFDHEIEIFKKWAINNGYLYKLHQSSKNEIEFVGPNGIEILNISVSLQNHQMDKYPYLDTFKFYDPKNGILKNFIDKDVMYRLTQSNGSLFNDEPEEVEAEIEEDNGW